MALEIVNQPLSSLWNISPKNTVNLHHFLLIGAFLVDQPVKNLPAMQGTLVQFLDWEDPLENRQATHSCGLDSKESTCKVGDLGSIPGLERSPGGGHDNLLQYSCLENPRS